VLPLLFSQPLLYMYFVRVKHDFCAAHALQFEDGSRELMHGHNWSVEAVIACPSLDAGGIGIDFLDVKAKMAALLDSRLDHQNLNDVEGLSTPNPTSEHLARWIAERLASDLSRPLTGARLHSVTVWETSDFGVTFEVDQSL